MKKLTKKLAPQNKFRIFGSKKLITNKRKMKKVFLALAIMAAITVTSCKQANEEMSKIDAPADSTQVDSVSVDTTAVDTTEVK